MDLKPTTAKLLRTVTPLRIAGVLVDLFTRVGKRSPPAEHKTQHVRFISIAVSNYVEKARWGLDMLEASPKSPLFYTEDLHPPAFAAFQTVPASKDQASQSPMIVWEDGPCVWGSETILQKYCSDPETVNLYPKEIEKEVKELENDLGARLGSSARCFGYFCLLDKSKKYYGVAAKFLTLNCSRIEQKLFGRMLDQGIAKGMMRIMKTNEFGESSEQEVRNIFSTMSKKLEANGGEYLMDTEDKKYGFTAADLSLAALAYFVLRPPEMGPFLVPEDEIPPKMLELGKDLRETLAGRHVLKMYKNHRPVDAETREIDLKKVDQNRIPWMEAGGVAAAIGAVVYGVLSLK